MTNSSLNGRQDRSQTHTTAVTDTEPNFNPDADKSPRAQSHAATSGLVLADRAEAAKGGGARLNERARSASPRARAANSTSSFGSGNITASSARARSASPRGLKDWAQSKQGQEIDKTIVDPNALERLFQGLYSCSGVYHSNDHANDC